MLQDNGFEKFGEYTLVKKLAVGGMAEIFLAQTKKTAGVSQFVVVKRILPQFSSNKKFRTMFKNEGKITSQLKHVNMVYHHKFGVEKGIYYIAMEYISGCSLKSLLAASQKKSKYLPIPYVIHIVRSIASALQYIHNSFDSETGKPLHLIHRDVTPHNIMIGFNGDVKLIDFGIAKASGVDLTSAGVVKGKFCYMSPEQISGEKIDRRSDIFSLGVVMWELLSGRKLFTGSSLQSVFKKIKDCNIPSISQIRPDVQKEVKNILKKMLIPDANNRYQQAEKIERELHLFLNAQYSSFSPYDFQTFVKNLYERDIAKERKYFIGIGQAIRKNQSRTSSFREKTKGSLVASTNEEYLDTGSNNVSLSKANQSTLKSASTKALSQTMDTYQSLSAEKKNLESDETNMHPAAPIYYSKTHVLNEKGLENQTPLKTNVEIELDDTQSNRSISTFDGLVGLYSQQKNRKKRSFLSSTIVAAALVMGVYLMNPLEFIPKDFFMILKQEQENEDFKVENESGELADKDEQIFEEDPVSADEIDNRKPSSVVKKIHVFIQTQPSGADVYLNGEKAEQQTPVLIAVPKEGKHKLIVVKKGYERFVVDSFSDLSSELRLKLKKIRKPGS